MSSEGIFLDLFNVTDSVDLFDIGNSNLFTEVVGAAPNPFAGLINSTFKNLHKQMIDSLLENDALTQKVRFVYTGSKFTNCDNCVYDPIGAKSANVFKQGGSQYFHNGQMCPMCGGQGKQVTTTSEDIYLMVVWNSSQWAKMASNSVRSPEVMIQTKSKAILMPKIMKVSYIELTDIEGYGVQRFVRYGNPEGCGFNNNHFIHTMWRKV